MLFQPNRQDLQRFQNAGLPLPERLQAAVLKRQVEFLAGRYCATEALKALGYEGEPVVGSQADRSPAWPSGWLGSISHSSDCAVALVAHRQQALGIGVDVESVLPPADVETISDMILHGSERDLLASQGYSPEQLLTVVFSIKESLYKALNQLGIKELDFKSACVQRVSPDGGFAAILANGVALPLQVPRLLTGRFILNGARVVSLLWIPKVTTVVERQPARSSRCVLT
ncbi:hypothetical protein CAI21_12560 [Alkalilimnicola ehrlichii]|nr:hypothetical protein CAI21_12560 [Alkalilimnicola ehrlichii]